MPSSDTATTSGREKTGQAFTFVWQHKLAFCASEVFRGSLFRAMFLEWRSVSFVLPYKGIFLYTKIYSTLNYKSFYVWGCEALTQKFLMIL